MIAPLQLDSIPVAAGPGAPEPAWRLRAAHVDLWIVVLDDLSAALTERARRVLSPDEAERARRFHFERDQRRFTAGRAVLRGLLGRHLGLEPQQVPLRYGAAGKPLLAPGAAATPALHFNVAHSDGLALIALTRIGEIGVDLERIREIPEWDSIASTCFPTAAAALRQLPEARRPEAFFCAWTRHEARLKASGAGLGGAAGAAGDTASAAGGQSSPDETAGGALAVHRLCPAPGFVGALAVGRCARWLNTFSWPPRSAVDFPDRRPGLRVRLPTSPVVPF